MSGGPFCKLFSPSNGGLFHLDGATVDVFLVDMHASVEISQRFTNPLDNALDATYTFGLVAGAAVCSFKMVRADGTEIGGSVMEKHAAQKEYDISVKKGRTAALGAEQTKDVFTINVGNIAAKETVTIKVRYLQVLTDDETRDQVRFIFPRTYAQRYGTAPTLAAASATTIPQAFAMNVIIQQSSAIKGISCPSGHPMQLELGQPGGHHVDASIPSDCLAKVIINEPSGSLVKDVLMVITATDLDRPRAFVEIQPEQGTFALGLTFVPRFTLPDISSGMEYIFLVDRSGSMAGTSMKLVREALIVLLRGLPTKGTKFNIFSFGTDATKLWPFSQAYTQTNLEKATEHVDSMVANYGGTEIASALKLVYSSLSTPFSRPVAVFLLTDGDAWDVEACVEKTKTAVKRLSTRENFMRVFTVGIDSGASTNTCDNIAKAGNGFSVYVAANEPIVGKCSRLVRAACTPTIENLCITWTGPESERENEEEFEIIEDAQSGKAIPDTKPPSVSLFDSRAEEEEKSVGPPPPPVVNLPEPPDIQQAPIQTPSLFPRTCSQLYAILSNKASPPGSITISGTVTTTGATVELSVPVMNLVQHYADPILFLHVLAANALIADREHGIHSFPPSLSSAFEDNDEVRNAYLKAEIVRLGIQYGLTSKHTSFVIIDRRDDDSQLNVEWFFEDDDSSDSSLLSAEEESDDDMGFGLFDGGDDLPTAPMPVTSSDNVSAMSAGEKLAAIARMQQFDGGFALSTKLLLLFGIQVGVDTIQALRTGLPNNVVATMFAHKWLIKNAGDEALDMREKAFEWLAEQLGGPDAVKGAVEKVDGLLVG